MARIDDGAISVDDTTRHSKQKQTTKKRGKSEQTHKLQMHSHYQSKKERETEKRVHEQRQRYTESELVLKIVPERVV